MRDAAQATDLFLDLTPERVLDAVEAAGLPCRPLCYPLNSFENRVYEVELADRQRVVAKFYRPGRWSREQLLEEHAFLAAAAAAEIPVCPALPFPAGETLSEIDGIFYSVFPRRGGRAPEEVDAPLAARLGRLVARLHNVAVALPARHRERLTSAEYLRRDLDWLAGGDWVPTALAPRYFGAARAIADAYDRLAEGVPTHLLHGDLHLGNLLVRDELLHVVDFDDARFGPPVQDLWLLLPGRDEETARLRGVFLDAYGELRAFDRRTLALIEPLRGLRLVHYACWLARRWHDPVFPRTWTHFGTDDYWRQETESLEEQLAWIEGERLADAEGRGRRAEAAGPAEEELTNRDLFWDWEEPKS